MTAEQRRRTIADWTLAGLDWRSWGVREITFVLYEQLVRDLYESGQHDALRTFLRATGDKSRLGALDRDIMGQRGGVAVETTPKLRGR